MSEMVLAGHPDKFCDQVADAIVAACMKYEPEAYAQIEVAAWCDEVWLNGGIATEKAIPFALEEIVHAVVRNIGYIDDSGAPRRYRVHDAVCIEQLNPQQWTRKVNDQSIVVGWAGYDARTNYLPPEHYLAHAFRNAIERHTRGALTTHDSPLITRNAGPDGKLLVRINESSDDWRLEHLLVTLQQSDGTSFLEMVEALEAVLAGAFEEVKRNDSRWSNSWEEVTLLINPNGPLINGGSDGDNGQTGRKLVMDYYGPRVALGGGALSGKHLSHIDRIGAIAARDAAVRAVKGGASECRVVVAWAPNEPGALDVIYEMTGRGPREPASFFHHDAMRDRYAGATITPGMPRGDHFLNPEYAWNR